MIIDVIRIYVLKKLMINLSTLLSEQRTNWEKYKPDPNKKMITISQSVLKLWKLCSKLTLQK